METVLWLLNGVSYALLVVIASLDLEQYNISEFALKVGLQELSAGEARRWRRLHKKLSNVIFLRHLKLVVLGVVIAVVFTALQGPLLGGVYALLCFTMARLISQLRIVRDWSQQLFVRVLDGVLRLTDILSPVLLVFGRPVLQPNVQPTSLAELRNQLEHLPQSVLESGQKKRLISVIESEHKVAKDVMTPKRNVVTVDPDATLGPVLLSELQKSGHGYFPVATKKAEPEGVLETADLADIHSAKQHQRVRDYMNEQLVWVEEDTAMYELVQAVLQEKRYVLMVRDLNGDFTGVITVADLMQQLLGIVKE